MLFFVELLEEERKLNCCSLLKTELLLEEERKLNCCSLLKTELLLEEERKLNCVHTVPGRSKQTPIRS